MTCVHLGGGGFLMLGGNVYAIRDGEGGNTFTFEDHSYCGPIRVSPKTGDPVALDFGPRSAFWPLYERWVAGGKKVDQLGRCILAPVPPPCVVCEGRGFLHEKASIRPLPSQRKRTYSKRACPNCHGDGRSFHNGTVSPLSERASPSEGPR